MGVAGAVKAGWHTIERLRAICTERLRSREGQKRERSKVRPTGLRCSGRIGDGDTNESRKSWTVKTDGRVAHVYLEPRVRVSVREAFGSAEQAGGLCESCYSIRL